MKREILPIRWLYRSIRQLRHLINFGWRYIIFFAFILITAILFTAVQQGQDVLLSTLEYSWGSFFLTFSLLFWAYSSWYTSRLIGYAALKHTPRQPRIFKMYNTHIPRIVGYLCFSVVEFALINLLAYKFIDNYGNIFFLGYLSFKLLVYKLINRQKLFHSFKKEFLWYLLFAQALLLLQSALLVNFNSLEVRIILITILIIINSLLFLIFTISRHTRNNKNNNQNTFEGTRQFITYVNSKEPAYTYAFYGLSVCAFILYLVGIFSLSFSRIVGPCNFFFLGTTIMQLGMGLITLLSVLNRINYHVPLLMLVLFVNFIFKADPYKVSMLTTQQSNNYHYRMPLETYFDKYLDVHKTSLTRQISCPCTLCSAMEGIAQCLLGSRKFELT
ncbi:MAG: hypothetical protein IPO27_14365 [Bacteroidetes bacterium]|nr:hypothetical protein [Bacteroidota bacterium]